MSELFPRSTAAKSETKSRSQKPILYEIPSGTPVGMSAFLIHNNPIIFPSPESFIPERWLPSEEDPEGVYLKRFLLSFSKGTRACLGIK